MRGGAQPTFRADDYPGLSKAPVVTLRLRDEEETKELGRWIAAELGAGDFLGLIGDLGAGKTTLMKGMVEARSKNSEQALSPTYSLVQVYETTPPIFHMDLYRLQNWADLESIGYWDYLDRDGIVCVEWLDRIPGAWPEQGVIILLSREGRQRTAVIWADEERGLSVRESISTLVSNDHDPEKE